MNLKNWELLKKAANIEPFEKTPVALIVDSPWIPGYTGISTIDYFTIKDKWLDANLKIKKDFPEVIFVPDFWVEFGMAAEPSGFGCKINFFENSTPTVNHLITSLDDIGRIINIKVPNPKTDGLMPLILNLYKNIEPQINRHNESIKIVAARGPLTILSHVMSLTELLTGIKMDPDNIHKLLKITSELTLNWLESQIEVLKDVEAILVLDDITGFLSREDYLEFAHPYFKKIFDNFVGFLKIFHNDTDSVICYEFLEDLGINIFNFTHKQDILKVKNLAGDKVCLMGNVPPLEILTNGSVEDVSLSAKNCLDKFTDMKGLILSAGGGVSPGTPKINIQTLINSTEKKE